MDEKELADSRRVRTRFVLNAGVAGAMGVLLMAVMLWNYRLVEMDDFLRVRVLAAQIISGVVAAICFGAAIYYINGAMGACAVRPRWYWRLFVDVKLRGFMLGQLVAMALAVGAVGLLLFHEPIPHADQSILYRGWSPPAVPG